MLKFFMSLAIIAGRGKLPLLLEKYLQNMEFIGIDLEDGRKASNFNISHNKYYAVKNLNITGIIDILIKDKIKNSILLGKVDKSTRYKADRESINNVAPILKNLGNWWRVQLCYQLHFF